MGIQSSAASVWTSQAKIGSTSACHNFYDAPRPLDVGAFPAIPREPERFSDITALRAWLREVIGAAFGESEAEGSNRPPTTMPDLRPEDLTDPEAIRKALPKPGSGIYLNPDRLLDELSAQVRGQNGALRRLADRVSRHVARRQPQRPATFFAIGGTGVGKTKTAEQLPVAMRALAPQSAGYGYLRLDMAEYQESHRISQLLGAPQGYVGYSEGAILVDTLNANPRTIVLFDEIEKAHPNILRALMNAMDAGRLSTSSNVRGREIDCRHAIFLFTSNLEADEILREMRDRRVDSESPIAEEICRRRLRASGLAPELIGRIGCFLIYVPLSIETRAEILTLTVARVAAEYGLRVTRIAPSVIITLLAQTRSGELGARPDEYLVDDLLGPALAQAASYGADREIEVQGGDGQPFECINHRHDGGTAHRSAESTKDKL